MRKKRKYVAKNAEMCYPLKVGGDIFMLVEYRVKNFMSFKNETVLSMVADPINDLEDTHVVKMGNMNLLKTAAIFGANASGKTNFIESLSFFRSLFSDITDMKKVIKDLPYFKFDNFSADKPISFEITFILNGKRHRYGIDLTSQGIVSEWLYFAPNRNEACYFERESDTITKIGTYFKPKKALIYIKPDPLRPFLYTLAQNSLREFDWAKNINNYLRFEIRSSNFPDNFFKSMLETEIKENKGIRFLSMDLIHRLIIDADFGIIDFSIEEKSRMEDSIFAEFKEFMKQKGKAVEDDKYETYMHHNKYDSNRNFIGTEKLPLEMESKGTLKFYCLLYPILFVLKLGGVLLVDEIESSLHPRLCEKILSLFNNQENNPNNAQLIFTTHNALLMNSEILRRDQIYFIEKNKYGESNLYSLFKDNSVRKGYNYMKSYLAGRFGAVPYLGSFMIK